MNEFDESTQHIFYEEFLKEFIAKNHTTLIATFIEKNHDEYYEHCEDMYHDHEGQDMEWEWKKTDKKGD